MATFTNTRPDQLRASGSRVYAPDSPQIEGAPRPVCNHRDEGLTEHQEVSLMSGSLEHMSARPDAHPGSGEYAPRSVAMDRALQTALTANRDKIGITIEPEHAGPLAGVFTTRIECVVDDIGCCDTSPAEIAALIPYMEELLALLEAVGCGELDRPAELVLTSEAAGVLAEILMVHARDCAGDQPERALEWLAAAHVLHMAEWVKGTTEYRTEIVGAVAA